MLPVTELNPCSKSIDPEFEEIYRQYSELVYRTAKGILGSAEDAEDVLQVIFVRLLRSQLSPSAKQNLKPYLYRAAVNQSLVLIKSRRRHVLTDDRRHLAILIAAAVAQAQRGAPQAGGTGNRLDLQTAWWTDAATTARLGLTDLQKLRIEGSFQAYRQNLTTAKETLEKEEAQLSKLLDVDSIDRPAVQIQVNKVIQARSDTERLNSAMSLEIREQLTRAQWTQLQQPNPPRGAATGGGRGGTPPSNPARILLQQSTTPASR